MNLWIPYARLYNPRFVYFLPIPFWFLFHSSSVRNEPERKMVTLLHRIFWRHLFMRTIFCIIQYLVKKKNRPYKKEYCQMRHYVIIHLWKMKNVEMNLKKENCSIYLWFFSKTCRRRSFILTSMSLNLFPEAGKLSN